MDQAAGCNGWKGKCVWFHALGFKCRASRVKSVCDNEKMSEIYAIRFGANTRKFDNFWIFELACGPGSRKFENSKLTDFCEN